VNRTIESENKSLVNEQNVPPNRVTNTDPIYYKDATELAALIRTKQLSSREVVQAHLDRIAAVNPKVNAIVTLMADDALKGADAADKAVKDGDALGPVHGVPFTIKDSIDTEGVLTQQASKLFAGNIPKKDATVVKRFKDAGAIPLAKTNLPEFAAWWETDNATTGRTNNPWNLDRSPAGSSGGESAAIAAGLSPISIGSDVALSLRGPAAWTGIAALKPTHGRVPLTGHNPPAMRHYWHIGPMARTIRDVALGYSILQGPDGVDGFAIHAKTAVPANPRFSGQPVRVGWVSDAAFGPVDPEITVAIKQVAELLKDRGFDVEEVGLSFFGKTDWVATYFTLWYGEMIPFLQKFAKGREADMYPIAATLLNTAQPALADYVDAELKVELLKSLFAGYFEKYDVLLCPVLPFTAKPHNYQDVLVNGVTVPNYHVMKATLPFNMTGLPGLSVPYSLSSEQLPINVQLVSRWLDEDTILRLGLLIESGNKVHNRHPML
jgi:aspartyl-tRNA(Asn)/glutamyl-tRNA(Gln) amidotransferase subunit A